MEHVNLINRIIEAENKARQISDEAHQKLQTLSIDLKEECAGIRHEYLERAEHRIAMVRRKENELANEKITEIDRQFQEDLKLLDKTFSDHGDEWVDKLFHLIVDRD